MQILTTPYMYTSVFGPLFPSAYSGAVYPLVPARPIAPIAVTTPVEPTFVGKGVTNPKSATLAVNDSSMRTFCLSTDIKT